MADYSFGKKPELIRAEPYSDFKQVYNRHWGFLLFSGSFSLSGADEREISMHLREFYCHLALMEASLSLFIKNKEQFAQDTLQVKKIINDALKQSSNLQVYSNQIEMFQACMTWLTLLLPYMRTAGVIPLEDTEEIVE